MVDDTVFLHGIGCPVSTDLFGSAEVLKLLVTQACFVLANSSIL